MPSRTRHQEQAATNTLAYTAIRRSQDELADWEITTLFYTAVHLIRSLLSRKNAQYRKPDLHYNGFRTALYALGEETMADTFEQLRGWSQDARYACKGEAWCSGKADLAGTALHRIRTRVENLHAQMDADGIPPDG